jgi:hypothetical protein
MKTFVLRLVLTSILLYALGAVAYALLHYPSDERPDVAGILGDYTRDLGSVFRRKEPAGPAVPGPASQGPERSAPPSLDDLRGDSHVSLALSRVVIPDSGRLPAAAAGMWDALRPLHARVLPEAIVELGRLRALRSTDKPAFERDRSAVRARLAAARETLLSYTQEQRPLDAAVKMLDVLEQLDAQLAAL